tara:strand:- start:415 stop:1170 length:756 start_codon:yes stop_codon:yes gene_type:complete
MENLTQPNRPDLISTVEVTEDLELGLIPAWSYSALKTFESCAYRSYIAKVKKIPEDFGPAAARGTEIHNEAEHYVDGTLGDLPQTLSKFTDKFQELKDLYEEAKVELEGEWGFTRDWEPCGWMDPGVWGRIKLDAFVNETETSARVIDYKTGKQFGNEIAHSQQALIYAIGSFFRYPDLEIAKTELWYLDHGTTMEQVYTRDEAMVFMPKLHDRAINMTTATKFPPNPSTYACKWCSYGKGPDPYCEWAIK